MKKRIKLHRILVAILTILVIYVGYRFCISMANNINKKEEKEISSVILSLEDNFDKNDYWVGSFNILWNNLNISNVSNTTDKNENIIANLNKMTFTKDNLTSDYYNKYGYLSSDLKKTMTKELKKKFSISIPTLETLDWDSEEYLLYTLLYKEFKFKYKFELLDNESFKTVDDVAYFGIKNTDDENKRGQVEVLYYKDINNFAIKLITTGSDEVIITRGIEGDNFLSIYENMVKLSEKYDGSEEFGVHDQLKVPIIEFNKNDIINELSGITLESDEDTIEIKEIYRDIIFDLGSDAKIIDEEKITTLDKSSRLFYVTSDFNLFLIEKKAELPYFAMNVNDISSFQELS